MQAFHDIFSIWPDIGAMATALDEKQDTVYRWQKRGRIPDTAWDRLIDAAKVKGRSLTVADLHAANRPTKPRKTSHKGRSLRRRRLDARVVP